VQRLFIKKINGPADKSGKTDAAISNHHASFINPLCAAIHNSKSLFYIDIF
jgi:hypothetical protein